MFRRVGVCVILWMLAGPVGAQEDIPNKVIGEATTAYSTGDQETAFETLSHIPGLLGVVPMFDRPAATRRAAIFFDLGRIQIATGDTAKARLALVEAFKLDPNVSRGVMQLAMDQAFDATQAFLAGMRRTHRQQALQKTTFWGAAARSLVFPGWGQLYRGRKKRGYGFMGASAALAAVWFVTDRSYRSAYNAYQKTRLDDLRLDQRADAPTSSDPFTDNFERAKSRAGRANLALGMLAAVWLSGVCDHLIVGPAQVSVLVPIR